MSVKAAQYIALGGFATIIFFTCIVMTGDITFATALTAILTTMVTLLTRLMEECDKHHQDIVDLCRSIKEFLVL
jgi:hypothetical protein